METSVLDWNRTALESLRNGQPEAAFELLQQAQHSLDSADESLQALTYNSFASYYRQTKDLASALTYSKKAFKLEVKAKDPVNAASTLLTMASIHSAWAAHAKALAISHKAVGLLLQKFSEKNGPLLDTLALAYFSVGTAYEHLQENKAAFHSFCEGLKVTKQHKLNGQVKTALNKKVKALLEKFKLERRRVKPHHPPRLETSLRGRKQSVHTRENRSESPWMRQTTRLKPLYEHKPRRPNRKFTTDDLLKELSSRVVNIPPIATRPGTRDAATRSIIRNIVTRAEDSPLVVAVLKAALARLFVEDLRTTATSVL